MNKDWLCLRQLIKRYRVSFATTWLLVILENILLAMIPLFIGFSIDGLLQGSLLELAWLGGAMVLLSLLAVARRIYDTRVYGSVKVALGLEVDQRNRELAVSIRSARLDMSRELVDFLEQDIPELITAGSQMLVALVVLALFSPPLAIAALVLLLVMLTLYGFFHHSFFRLNQALNAQTERQVTLLERGPGYLLQKHLKLLRHWEVKLSDREAVLYGVIFLAVTAFLLSNLWLATAIVDISSGSLFSIVTYSWGFVEAALVLPVTLQSLTRLSEIIKRINNQGHGSLARVSAE